MRRTSTTHAASALSRGVRATQTAEIERTADTRSGEDDPAREPSALREPLRQEDHCGQVGDAAAESQTDALQEDEVPHLGTHWIELGAIQGI